MSVTLAEVAQYTGISLSEPLLPVLLSAAEAMIGQRLDQDAQEEIPTVVRDLAVRELVRELWWRRKAPGGLVKWTDDSPPVAMARDAMTAVMPLLAPYMGVGDLA